MCQIRKVISIFVPFKGNKRILNGLFYPILRLNSPSEIERVCSGICKVLREFINEIPELDNCLIDSDYLEMSDVNMNDPKLFLYQSGYLTIKKVVGSSYMLGYPNREVQNAMLGMSLPNG